jgi:hypothetical protein
LKNASDFEQRHAADGDQSRLPPYEKPTITVMSEDEVLRSFQITHAMATWWGP